MQLLQDGAVAALSAIGLASLIWLIAAALLHPRRRGTLDAVAVIPASGAAEALEHTVRALERSRYEEGGFARIVILDRGLDESARAVAALLCREAYDVSLCTAGELAAQLAQPLEKG